MSPDIKALLETESRRQRALIQADLATLENLLADDLIHIHSTGMVHSKSQFLNHVERMGGFVAIARAEPQITIHRDIAILTGPTCNTVRLLESGEEKVRYGFSTLVLRRAVSGWKIILSQLTPIQERNTA
ncbi:MAG: nuclear transport factor 2 family protein [Enterobacterales bacterium endosymbiont of Blomia tropicalis]|uniref:nuclear transport factor 2 family protein n=1 Tax=Mixta mediterraneensis TaxID=2758443 RepID=UPI0025A8AD1C|nr:nuclear transport factor 2 family protein [Mixta mediterraneensis]MDL4914476.1 nuclear transport factor 2 family protein [Mixta mediterraneensis]